MGASESKVSVKRNSDHDLLINMPKPNQRCHIVNVNQTEDWLQDAEKKLEVQDSEILDDIESNAELLILNRDWKKDWQSLSSSQQEIIRKSKNETVANFKKMCTEKSMVVIAFVGKVNVGKSALIHALFGIPKEEPPLVSPLAGATYAANVFRLDEHLLVVDLPGFGDPNNIADESILRFVRNHADIVVFVTTMDANDGTTKDMYVKTKAECPTKKIFIVLNKTDKSSDAEITLVEKQVRQMFQLAQSEKIYRTFAKNYWLEEHAIPQHSGVIGDGCLNGAIFDYLENEDNIKSLYFARSMDDPGRRDKKAKAIIAASCIAMVSAVWVPFIGSVTSFAIMVSALHGLAKLYKVELDSEVGKKFKKQCLPNIFVRFLFVVTGTLSDVIPGAYVALNSVESVMATILGLSVLMPAYYMFRNNIPLDDINRFRKFKETFGRYATLPRLLELQKQGIGLRDILNILDEHVTSEMNPEASTDSAMHVSFPRCYICCGDLTKSDQNFGLTECGFVERLCSSCRLQLPKCGNLEAEEKSSLTEILQERECKHCRFKNCSLIRIYGDLNDQGGECPICMKDFSKVNSAILEPCGHVFCRDDAINLSESMQRCPFCFANISSIRDIKRV